MWFRRKREDPSAPHPGRDTARTGLEAALANDAGQGDPVLVESGLMHDALVEDRAALLPAQALPGRLAGLSATGRRVSALVGDPAGLAQSLAPMAARHLPAVIHLAARARTRQSGATQGSHDAVHALADLGALVFHASSVQDVADLDLVARRAAELALVPALVVQDVIDTGWSVQPVKLLDTAAANIYLGQADDRVPSPTPAQRLLFGERRRRIPRLVDPDHPAGIGGVQDPTDFVRSLAAQQPFFNDHLTDAIEQATSEFAALTGRDHGPFLSHRLNGAEHIVVCMGAVFEPLAALCDGLAEDKTLRFGLIGVTQLRPFPGGALTRLLKGRRWVTVLERTDAALAEDLPLLREVRAAIDRAAENGRTPSEPPYPDHAALDPGGPRPGLLSGRFGIGGALPEERELLAVAHNMASESPRRRFFLGTDFRPDQRRLPRLEVRQQEVARDYPTLDALSLPAADAAGMAPDGVHVIRLHGATSGAGLQAGNHVARALAEIPGCHVRTRPAACPDHWLKPGLLTLAFGDAPIGAVPEQADAVLVADEALLESVLEHPVRTGGHLVLMTRQPAESIRQLLSPRVEDWVRRNDLDVHVLSPGAAQDPLEEEAGPWLDPIAAWSLLGSALHGLAPDLADDCRTRLVALVEDERSHHPSVAEAIGRLFDRGRAAVAVDWRQWPEGERAIADEPIAPWTAPTVDGPPLFDPNRFWNATGYLDDSGQRRHGAPDPALAMGLMPAASSAHRNLSPHRSRTPAWVPENCSGCGQCWALCPDSALPAMSMSTGRWIEQTVNRLKAQGHPVTQLNRIAGHLGKMAHQVVRGDDLGQLRTLSDLLETAFERLAEKMALDDAALAAVQSELAHLLDEVRDIPFARSEAHFLEPEATQAGAGQLLTIPFDPSCCKGCGICVDRCPDRAFEWHRYTAERERADRRLVALRRDSLDQSPDTTGMSPTTATFARLLDGRAYYNLVGGDSAPPGSGAKTALHLILAALASEHLDQHRKHAERLGSLIEQLLARIQGTVADAVRINDFEQFGKRLERFQGHLDAGQLPDLLGQTDETLDADRLRRLSAIIQSLQDQQARYRSGRRAPVLMALDPGTLAGWSGHFPDNPHVNPWISQAPGDTVSLAEGLFDGTARQLCDDLAVCRQAERELADGQGPIDDAPPDLDWADLNETERRLMPAVLAIAPGDGLSWPEVRSVLDGDRPLRLVLIDEVGPGPTRQSEDAALLAVGRCRAPVLQAAIGHPEALIDGVIELSRTDRPGLISVHAPDPGRCRIPSDEVAHRARLAVDTRAVPLFRFDGRQLDLDDNPDPGAEAVIREWIERDAAGAERSRTGPLTAADWALGQGQFHDQFRIRSRGHVNSEWVPLSQSLDAEDDEGRTRFIDCIDSQGRPFVAEVSPAMHALSVAARQRWRRLRRLARAPVGHPVPEPADAPAVPVATPAPSPAAASHDAHAALVQRLLALCDLPGDGEGAQSSLRQFLAERRAAESPDPSDEH